MPKMIKVKFARIADVLDFLHQANLTKFELDALNMILATDQQVDPELIITYNGNILEEYDDPIN